MGLFPCCQPLVWSCFQIPSTCLCVCVLWGKGSENKIFKKRYADAGSWMDVYLSAVTYAIFNHILLLKIGHMVILGCKGGWDT